MVTTYGLGSYITTRLSPLKAMRLPGCERTEAVKPTLQVGESRRLTLAAADRNFSFFRKLNYLTCESHCEVLIYNNPSATSSNFVRRTEFWDSRRSTRQSSRSSRLVDCTCRRDRARFFGEKELRFSVAFA